MKKSVAFALDEKTKRRPSKPTLGNKLQNTGKTSLSRSENFHSVYRKLYYHSTSDENDSSDSIDYSTDNNKKEVKNKTQDGKKSHNDQKVENESDSSEKTDFWDELADDSEYGEIVDIDEMFTSDQLKIYDSALERRIQINGQKYKICHNSKNTETLYRAIARALTGDEQGYNAVQTKIHKEMETHPAFYIETNEKDFASIQSDIGINECSQHNIRNLLHFTQVMKKYKVERCKSKFTKESPGIVELSAAAAYYHFQYILFDLIETVDSLNNSVLQVKKIGWDPFLWKKSYAKEIPSRVCYYFLRTGNFRGNWCYEYIVPIGEPPSKSVASTSEVKLFDCIPVEKFHLKFESKQEETFHTPLIKADIPHVLSVDHRNFRLKKTVAHDLWSLLAEVLYRKIRHAPMIKAASETTRMKQAYFFHLSRARKRREMRGLTTSTVKLNNMHSNVKLTAKSSYSRGDPEDLEMAASELAFSFTIIGADTKGHLFHKDIILPRQDDAYYTSKVRMTDSAFFKTSGKIKPPKDPQPYYAFFVRYRKDRSADWYLLEDIGKNYSLEHKVYGNALEGNSKKWQGGIYLRPPILTKSYLHATVKEIEVANGWEVETDVRWRDKLRNLGDRLEDFFTSWFIYITTWFQTVLFTRTKYYNGKVGPHEQPRLYFTSEEY